MSNPEDAQWREVYAATYPRLVAQLTGVTGNRAEAEDVVQEAFVRAMARRRLPTSLDHPEAWVRRIAVNMARSRWRRTQRFLHLAPRLHTEEHGLDPDVSMTILAALGQLPTAQREAIALFHLADLPLREVAELLDVPEGTIKARLSRGRAALATLLNHDRVEDYRV